MNDSFLHQATEDADLVWGQGRKILCACGAELGMWARRCAACKAKNPFARLLKKRARIESRMVTAYKPVQPIFERLVENKGGRGLWNKARLKFKPVGDLLRLPTAMWRSDAEYQELKRFDAQFAKGVSSWLWRLFFGAR